MSLTAEAQETIAHFFMLADEDGDGYITLDDMRRTLGDKAGLAEVGITRTAVTYLVRWFNSNKSEFVNTLISVDDLLDDEGSDS